MGTTLSVNIFFASEPDLVNIRNRESIDIDGSLTVCTEAIKVKPERLFFRYEMQ